MTHSLTTSDRGIKALVLTKPTKKTDYSLTTQPAVPDHYAQLPPKKRAAIDRRMNIVKAVISIMKAGAVKSGFSLNKAITQVIEQQLIDTSPATVRRWVSQHEAGGLMALLPKNFGSRRKQQPWETHAKELYFQTSQPSVNAICCELQYGLGYATATWARVNNYLAQFATNAPQRIGQHNHRLNHGLYKDRHFENLDVGVCYQGDGHGMDLYVAHPNSGRPTRFELTGYIDMKSLYVPSVYVSEAESANTTLFSLSDAIEQENHVPYMLYLDNGCGYKAKMMTAEHTGFYERMGISTIFSIPGNPRGKGQIERWFRTFEQQFSRLIGAGYVGRDHDPRTAAVWFNKAVKDQTLMLSYRQLLDALQCYRIRYNNQPHQSLGGKTPAQVWAELKSSPPIADSYARLRPQVKRKVRKGGSIFLDNRRYASSALVSLRGAEVIVEYQLFDDAQIDVFNLRQEYICTLECVQKSAAIPSSRIIEAQTKRLIAQNKRLHNKQLINEAKALPVIDAQTLDYAAITGKQTLDAADSQLIDINILDF